MAWVVPWKGGGRSWHPSLDAARRWGLAGTGNPHATLPKLTYVSKGLSGDSSLMQLHGVWHTSSLLEKVLADAGGRWETPLLARG